MARLRGSDIVDETLTGSDIQDGTVVNSDLANMAQSTIKGRAAGGGTGVPQDLTSAQATAILDNVVGDSGSGGTKGLVPAPGAGDAAAGKFLKADGTFAVPGTGSAITSLTGDVTGSGPGAAATTIAADTVTFSKMQNIATDSLIGRDTAGTGDPENILLNATLSMDGSGNLQRAELTGDISAPAGSNTTTLATVNSNVGSFTRASVTVNAKGLVTAASSGGAISLTADVSGTLPIANGGSGQTTANAALNAFLPSQTGNNGKFLQTDGSNTSWATASGGSVTDYGFQGYISGGSCSTTNTGAFALPTSASSMNLGTYTNENFGTVSIYNSGGTNYPGITFTPPAAGIYSINIKGYMGVNTASRWPRCNLRWSIDSTILDEAYFWSDSSSSAHSIRLSCMVKLTSLTSTSIFPYFTSDGGSNTITIQGSGHSQQSDWFFNIYKIN